MPQLYNAGQLFTDIKRINAKDIEDFGSDETSQQDAIFSFMNHVQFSLAKLIEKVVSSDAKLLSSDGYVTFTQSGQTISDMFEPKTILYMENGVHKEMPKRTSDVAPTGWWRESQNNEIHIRGFTGSKPFPSTEYTLKYLRYPAKITLPTDLVDCPPSGYKQLIFGVSELIKLSKNSYAGSDYMGQKSVQQYNNLMQGTVSGRVTGNTGQPSSFNDATIAKG